MPAATFYQAVIDLKRELLARALADAGGNRTHAARALGLERTYFCRLIREFAINPRQYAPAFVTDDDVERSA